MIINKESDESSAQQINYCKCCAFEYVFQMRKHEKYDKY